MKLHPKKDMGMRPVAVSSTLHIPKADAAALKVGDIFRLKDLCNVQIDSIEPSGRIVGRHVPDSTVPKKIQWVSTEKIPCTVLIPGDLLDASGEFNTESLKKAEGFCEGACVNIKPGDIVQFERFGFCRLDKNEGGSLTFVFSC